MSSRKNEHEMKILHIIQSFHIGGIEKLVFSIMQADIKNVFILAIEGSSEESLKAWPMLAKFQANLFFANKKNGFNKSVITKIIHTCKTHSFSVIHSHHIGPLIYASLATLTLRNIKHIHTEHDVWHLRKWKDWIIQWLIFKSRKNIRLVAVSHYVLEALKSYFPRKEATIIHNGVDTNLFQPGEKNDARLYFNLPSSGTIIGNAGRLESIKGQSYLIEAMLKLPHDYYLIIAGQGKLHSILLDQIRDLGLSDKVRLLNGVEEMVLFYQACDLFCLSSLDEGLPLTILEAQSCNVPVICSNVGGCSEGIAPNSGILVPAMNPDAIARACLVFNQKKAPPREFIIKNFSFETLLKNYKQLYLKRV
jgi:glycosyltransferase involved in cell wall biosynthesis